MEASVTSFTLPNGLTVIHSHRAGSPSVALSLRVIAGSQYELPHETGVAHFLEHLVSDGTENYPNEKAIAGLIDERGGYRNATTTKETVEYYVKLLAEDDEVAFEYLSEIVMRPLLRDESVEKQKKIIEQEILRFKNNPEMYAPRLLSSAVFPGTRYGGLVTGDIADIQKLSHPIIAGYWQRTHVARNMALAVCGDLPLEQVRALAESYFSAMPAGEKIAPIVLAVSPAEQPAREVRAETKQAMLSVGFQAFAENDPHRYAAHLLLHILCSGKTSRLRYEIREKRGLAYSISCHQSAGRTTGTFAVHAGLAEAKISECLQVIQSELKSLSVEYLPQMERDKALAYIKANRAFSFENPLAEASYYSDQWCMTGTIQPLETELKAYEKTAADDKFIQETAAQLFSAPPAVALISSQG